MVCICIESFPKTEKASIAAVCCSCLQRLLQESWCCSRLLGRAWANEPACGLAEMSNTRLTANALEPEYVGKGICLQHQREPHLLMAEEKDTERERREENSPWEWVCAWAHVRE